VDPETTCDYKTTKEVFRWYFV